MTFGASRGCLIVLLLIGTNGCRCEDEPSRSPSGPPDATGAASASAAPLAAPLVEAVTGLPGNTLTPRDAKHAPPGTLKVAAFLRVRQPDCPPCSVGSECVPCPLPFHQLSSVSASVKSHAGDILHADFAMPRPAIGADTPYVFEGRFATRTVELRGTSRKATVLEVARILRLEPATALRVGAQLSVMNLDRTCGQDADCRVVDRWPMGFGRCCAKCPSDAVSATATSLISNICASSTTDGCPLYGACAAGRPRCVKGRCRAE